MSDNRESDALAYVNEAIDALSIRMWRGDDVDDLKEISGPECTIAIELDRIDRAIGIKGTSVFASLADAVTQAAIALYAARDVLRTQP